MKRICRQHGISRWPSRKINKVNRSLTKLKRVIESVQGAEGAFTLTSLGKTPIPVTVGSVSWQTGGFSGANQQDQSGAGLSEFPRDRNDESPPVVGSGSDERAETSNQLLGGGTGENEEFISKSPRFLAGEGSHRSKSRSGSREESIGTPTSQGSCQGSPPPIGNDSSPHNDEHRVSPSQEQQQQQQQLMKIGGSMNFKYQPTGEINLSSAFSIDAFMTAQVQEPFGAMLVEDAGSSHDLRNLCSTGDALFDERVPDYSWNNPMGGSEAIPRSCMGSSNPGERIPQFGARPEVKTITIKATYREDIIRFRLPLDSGIEKLKEEIAKRLKLDIGPFEIKYLDDDHEWVLIACDADLQECVDISKSSGSNMIRLLVNDIMPNLGSSCESSGECGVRM